jgi:phosphohistidine phosphatase SixA
MGIRFPGHTGLNGWSQSLSPHGVESVWRSQGEDTALTTRVILVRHGQSTYNLKKLIQGQIDVSTLTDLGVAQARQVGETLKAIAFDAIYASPLKRAFQTASTIREVMATAQASAPPPHHPGQSQGN